MRVRLVGLTLAVMTLGVAAGGVLLWRQHSKGAQGSLGHFTLPGWEDVLIGGNPVKDTPCQFFDRLKADNCVGTRQTSIGDIGQIEVIRRSDVGIAVIAAQIDAPAAAALDKRWGTPHSVTKQTTTWCSSDGSEGAILTTPEYGAPRVLITMTTRAQDLVGELPFERADCGPHSTKHVPAAHAAAAQKDVAPPATQPVRIATLHPAEIRASSTHKPAAGYAFAAANLIDGDLSTSWQAANGERSPWIELDFVVPVTITSVSIANGFQAHDRFGDEYLLNDRISRARLLFDDGSEVKLAVDEGRRGFVESQVPDKKTRRLKLQVDEALPGSKWHDLAISEIKVRGRCECWIADVDGANPRPCEDDDRMVWLESGPCDE